MQSVQLINETDSSAVCSLISHLNSLHLNTPGVAGHTEDLQHGVSYLLSGREKRGERVGAEDRAEGGGCEVLDTLNIKQD